MQVHGETNPKRQELSRDLGASLKETARAGN